jgi:hypothetical protein
MSDAMDRFVKASEEFRHIAKYAENTVQNIRFGASLLENWRQLMVVNCSARFPAGVSLHAHSNVAFDASNWPTGECVGEILAKYHEAGELAQIAYDVLSESEKQSAQPPQYHH